VGDVVGRIQSHEMFLMGEIEPPQAKGDLALKAKGEHKSKKKSKGKAPQLSSSEASDDSSDEEGDEDTKLAAAAAAERAVLPLLLLQLYHPQALSICEVMAPFYAWAS